MEVQIDIKIGIVGLTPETKDTMLAVLNDFK